MEEIPAGVIKKEYPFESNNRREEHDMSQRRIVQSVREMVDIAAQVCPLLHISSVHFMAKFTLTAPIRTGKVARTAAAKNREMIFSGLFGSDRNVWVISASLPYRNGDSDAGAGEFASSSTLRLKARSLYAFDDPKEPMTMLASMGLGDFRNWDGKSFED